MEDSEVKQLIKEVSDSMEAKGYDAVNQLVGYLTTNDLGYIPLFGNNRNKIAKLDRTVILESMLKEYIK